MTEQYPQYINSFSQNDKDVLANFWHPVALQSEVRDKPVAVTLLYENLVIYRTSKAVTIAKNQCPHRGVRLDMGWLDNDQLICAYHGLHYNAEGKCSLIPAAGSDAKIPDKLRLSTYPVVERYGLIWVCLKPEPRYPIPEWPILEETDLQKYIFAETWQVFAGRHAENFNDTAHIPWAHAGTFGVREKPLIEKYIPTETDYGFYIKTQVTATAGNAQEYVGKYSQVTNEYFFTFPFASGMKMHYETGEEYAYHVASPISATTSRIFFLGARNYDLDKPVDDWVKFFQSVNKEDKSIVENQYPKIFSLDLSQEFHLPYDAFSVAYRRKWKEIGLADM